MKKHAHAGSVKVAHYDGPAEISFLGRNWQIGVAQEVSAEEWQRMQARADFAEFDFRLAASGGPSEKTQISEKE